MRDACTNASPASDRSGEPKLAGSDADLGAARRYSKSLILGLRLLRCFTAAQPVLGVADLSRMLDATPSTTHRYASTLVQLDYLEQVRGRKYRLARGAADIGLAAICCHGLSAVSSYWLYWLRTKTGYTAGVGVIDGDDLLYVAWLPSVRAGEAEQATSRRAGWRIPAHTSAAGKAILAFKAERDWPSKTHKQVTRTRRCHSRLLDELAEVCERGYALSPAGSAEPGSAIAAPVLGVSDVIAAVQLTAFANDAGISALRDMAELVITAAQGIGDQLEGQDQ